MEDKTLLRMRSTPKGKIVSYKSRSPLKMVWLVVFGLMAHSDSNSVYIGPSARKGDR